VGRGQQHSQAAVLVLAYLPAGGVDQVEYLVEGDRVYGDGAPTERGQGQHVVGTALDPGQQPERPPARAVFGRHAHPVGQLVADQRQGARGQHGDQQPGAGRPGGHRRVVMVDDLGDDQVLEQVQAGVVRALGGDATGLRGGVHVERWHAPRSCGELPGGAGEHLGCGVDRPGRDLQPADELLLGEDPDHRRAPDEHLRRDGVQPGGDLDQWRRGVQPDADDQWTAHTGRDP
jgi:hypothetical protein